MDLEYIDLKARLLGSLLFFVQTFYKERTGRDFIISSPAGREPREITVCRALVDVFLLKSPHLVINMPPGYGKSELIIHFVCWAMAHYPDCNFLYISYSSEIATKHTYTIKTIMELPLYRRIFGVEIKSDSSAKDNFQTKHGGSIKAFGSSGSITGQDSGLPHLDRFSGATLMDDMHKPDEVHSDTMRQRVIDNYKGTIIQRRRGPNVPQLMICQRLREGDLPDFVLSGDDQFKWDNIVLAARDAAGNALDPHLHSLTQLREMEEKNPYNFFSQMQQTPQPAGGTIFKPEWFVLKDEEPQFFATFVTADTAETEKEFNDATVFSFWGCYYIEQFGIITDIIGLQWIDCYELRVQPKDLQSEFVQWFTNCRRHKTPPNLVVVEKKSTGVTLLSTLQQVQGLTVIDCNRDDLNQGKGFRNKTDRFLAVQPYIANGQVSLLRHAKHVDLVLKHCTKITANQTHRFDDIADTMADAVRAALIDKIVPRGAHDAPKEAAKAQQVMGMTIDLMAAKRARTTSPW
jgi:predicted phage terminase large subunit-like protein